MWVSISALFLALCAVLGFIWLWLELRRKLEKPDIGELLKTASEGLLENYKRSLKSIETEWDDMYQKFSRLAGRMDRKKALEAPEKQSESSNGNGAFNSRSDVIRRARRV